MELLPDKYCSSPAELRKSEKKLWNPQFDSVFFAHRLQLLSQAQESITAAVG